MNKVFLTICAAILFAGCTHASQRDLTRLRTDLRAEMQHTANSRALAVHECANTRAYVMEAAYWCRHHPASTMAPRMCAIGRLWESYCLVTVPRGSTRVLTNPRPGVDLALKRLIQRFNAELSTTEQESTDTISEVVEEQPAILRERDPRTF